MANENTCTVVETSKELKFNGFAQLDNGLSIQFISS